MNAALIIAGDWFRLVRDQKSFRVMTGLAVAAVLVLAGIRIDAGHISLFFIWDIELDGFGKLVTKHGLAVTAGDILVHSITTIYVTILPIVVYFAALFATGGVVPELLRKGRIETILARPLRRGEFVIGTFLGGLAYVFAIGCILVLGSWLAFAVRGRVLHPIFAANVGVIVAQYAILHALALFFGVLLRSGGGAIILTLLAWFLGKLVIGMHALKILIESGDAPAEIGFMKTFVTGALGQTVDVLYVILPKGPEIDHLSEMISDIVAGTSLTGALAKTEKLDSIQRGLDWPLIAGSSVGLIALVLFASTRILRRRDL